MAKAQVAKARFVTEVAPPLVVPVMRRRKLPTCGLDTIAEDDREQLAYGPSSDHAAAWSRRERAGGLMRELSNCFPDGHGKEHAGGSWEGGHKLGHRRVVKI